MTNYIQELSYLFAGHVEDSKIGDITAVLNTEDAFKLVRLLDLNKYDDFSIRDNGEYHFVSSTVGEKKDFFVENIIGLNGNVVHDETDILIIAEYLPEIIQEQLLQGVYKVAIEITSEVTHESITSVLAEIAGEITNE